MNLLARFSPLVFALFVSGFSLGFAPVLADELPKDTNTIESLTPAQARKLVEKHRGSQLLSLPRLTTLNADSAKALAEFKGNIISLNGLTTLDAATAEALAEFEGEQLSLNGMTALDAVTAKVLAGFKGSVLLLHGLTTLDAATAKALVEFKGELTLPDKVEKAFFAENPLTPEMALAWAVVSNGNLSHVTTLDSPDSVAVAQALATRKGRLALPNLKKISPKTLTALIEKRDVEIPFVETLEFIPEPDGGGNDDFAIPKWLEELEERRRGRAGLILQEPGRAGGRVRAVVREPEVN